MRRGRVRAVAVLGVVVLVAAVLAGLSASGADWHARPGRTRAAVAAPADPRAPLAVSLVLRLPRRAAMERFLARRDTGGAIAPAAFGARFGLPEETIASLRRALRNHGLHAAPTLPQRTAIRVGATIGRIEALFSTRLITGRDARGQAYLRPLTPPRLPGWMRGRVAAVTGLDTRSLLRPADVPADGLDPATVSRAYDLTPLRQAGIDGSGQTVAVVSLDSFQDSDLSAYERHFNLTGPPVQHIPVAGGVGPGPGQDEVALDVETIRGIAPGAQVLDYEASQSNASSADVINQIVAEHRAAVITTSWGQCDLTMSSDSRIAEEDALSAAQAAGITIFAASGDNGGYDCQAENLGDRRPSVDWPAASDHVVAAGGTRLAVRQDGSYLAEYGWQDILQGGGSGGGLASATPRPAWQAAPGVSNGFSDGHRQVPDVAGPADPASGMAIYSQGHWNEIGGTSAAAPFWAANAALVREYLARHGGREPGFLGPLLYRLAADPRTAGAFHRPLRGGNRLFSVTPGWNYVTGLGSPDVAVLARALAVLLRSGT